MNRPNIALISDIAHDFTELNIKRQDLEVSEQQTVDGIAKGIRDCGFNVFHLEDPSQIYTHMTKHPNTVVLSIWSGINNRNRRAIVPSICEAHNIPYIGADPYVAMITSDKELSKTLCEEFNIKAPKGMLVRHPDMSERISSLKMPLVVKPLMEGGSIGITQDSKVNTSLDGKRPANHI